MLLSDDVLDEWFYFFHRQSRFPTDGTVSDGSMIDNILHARGSSSSVLQVSWCLKWSWINWWSLYSMSILRAHSDDIHVVIDCLFLDFLLNVKKLKNEQNLDARLLQKDKFSTWMALKIQALYVGSFRSLHKPSRTAMNLILKFETLSHLILISGSSKLNHILIRPRVSDTLEKF